VEYLRRPTVLAVIAAGLLVVNLVWLAIEGDSGAAVAIDDPLAGATASPAPGASPTTADSGPGSDSNAGESAAGTSGEASPADGAPDEPQQGPTGDGSGDGQAVLTAPTPGTYTYASSGSWSYDDGTAEEHQLPATATGTVTGDGDQWSLRLVAGQQYADRFTFTIGADGGLDWDAWVLERTINEQRSTTEYSCSADTAWYRPGAEAGRTLTHVCEEASGSVSTGEVELAGTEEVTLGDGTVVAADHIVYRTTDSSTSDQFEITGEGRLDIWLDPGTGLRVQEQRSSRTTTTDADGREYVYTEEVSFLLQSLVPDA
jgi:hypothetical protein